MTRNKVRRKESLHYKGHSHSFKLPELNLRKVVARARDLDLFALGNERLVIAVVLVTTAANFFAVVAGLAKVEIATLWITISEAK